jgi:hypothetical protein
MEIILYRGHIFMYGIKHFGCPCGCGSWTSILKTLRVKNGRKRDQSEGCRKVWSTFDSQNDRQWAEFESPNRSPHFGRGIEHAGTWMLHHHYVVILELWTTSKGSWQPSWGHFYMKTSSTATGSGNKLSGGVWLPKGTTLKDTMLIFNSVINKKFIARRITF